MWPDPLYAECTRRAADKVGGFVALGLRIGVPAGTLERWARGYGAPTEFQFLKLVDILYEVDPPAPATPPPDAPNPGATPTRS